MLWFVAELYNYGKLFQLLKQVTIQTIKLWIYSELVLVVVLLRKLCTNRCDPQKLTD